MRNALLIGACTYGEGFQDLPEAARDLDLMEAALRLRGFTEITRIEDPKDGSQGGGQENAVLRSAEELEAAIVEFLKSSKVGDIHLVYWSGHGVSRDGRDWLVPAGKSREEAELTSHRVRIDYSDVVEQSAGGQVLFVLDACRTERLDGERHWGDGYREDRRQEERFIRLYGCGAEQVCWSRKGDDGEEGVFTAALAGVLSEGSERTLAEVLEATRQRCLELQPDPDRVQEPRIDLKESAGPILTTIFFPTREAAANPAASLTPGDEGTVWVVLLLSEAGAERDVVATVRTSIPDSDQNRARIEDEAGMPLDPELRIVPITTALASPEHWRAVVRLLCRAPVVVVDASKFEPGVMMLLGIRAVVRRGVTLTTTSDELDESHLSKLPFNIQETKLVGEHPDHAHPQHPTNLIGAAVAEGFAQLRGNRSYLDLPAFDAVRCLPAETQQGAPVKRTVLVLCSFDPAYEPHWRWLSKKLKFEAAPHPFKRMLDIDSPRLVGPTLYEHLRWSDRCVFDWTHWRANVFFELGVRLACSALDPIGLIDHAEVDAARGGADGRQRAQLLDLLRPTEYVPGEKKSPQVTEAFARYQRMVEGKAGDPPAGALKPGETYERIVLEYEWSQEAITRSPEEELRAFVESHTGLDPESRAGAYPSLFAGNREYASELRRSVQERWIAAWYYLSRRYDDKAFEDDPELRRRRRELGEIVFRWLSKRDRDHKRIRAEILPFLDEYDKAPGA